MGEATSGGSRGSDDPAPPTPEWLQELGVELEPGHFARVLSLLHQRLEERVGYRVVDALNEEELSVFVELLDEGQDPSAAGEWLFRHSPNRGEIVRQEIEKIAARIRDDPAGFSRSALATLSRTEAEYDRPTSGPVQEPGQRGRR